MILAREYKQLTLKNPPQSMTVLHVIAQGLPLNAVDNMSRIFGINRTRVAALLGVTPRSLQQLKKNDQGATR
ncbi:MAG: antitoxin Xre-like helix-turn-helix domain-containing protein, partial [Paraglaciecola chathamensis]